MLKESLWENMSTCFGRSCNCSMLFTPTSPSSATKSTGLPHSHLHFPQLHLPLWVILILRALPNPLLPQPLVPPPDHYSGDLGSCSSNTVEITSCAFTVVSPDTISPSARLCKKNWLPNDRRHIGEPDVLQSILIVLHPSSGHASPYPFLFLWIPVLTTI